MTDYPQMFRRMVVRSAEAALAGIDPKALKLGEEERERSLYALSMALNLDEAWPAAGRLALRLAPHMEMQQVSHAWLDYLEQAAAQAAAQRDMRQEAHLCLQIGRIYGMLSEYAAAERYLREAHRLGLVLDEADLQARALHRLAQTAAEAGNFQEACTLVDQVLPLVAPDSLVCGHCYTVLGLTAMRQGHWHDAIQWYGQAYQILRGHGEQRYIVQAARTLGTAYRYAKQYDQALDYYRQSLQALGDLEFSFEYATTQMEFGVTYWYLGRCADALTCFAECEPIFVKSGSRYMLAHLYNNRGLALRDLNRTLEAEEAFYSSIQIMRELKMPLWVANALESLGGLYQRMGDVRKAEAIWSQALEELALLPEAPQYLHDLLVRRLEEIGAKQEEVGGEPPP
jgi:tetratricopeptide (TPR) repeat protein